MPFIPTPRTVKVCMRYLTNGQNACNVFHVDVQADPTTVEMTAVGVVFFQWFDTWLKPLVNAATSLQAIEITDVSQENGQGIIYNSGLPISGTATGDTMPNNVTVTTKLASGLMGRSQRGRSYFVGMDRENTTANRQQITAAFQDALLEAWEQLIDAITQEGFLLVVKSLFHNGVPRTVGQTTEIQNAVVNTTLDSQRRRLPERGE